ncbi:MULTISPECIES: hypothetical protein [Leptolyngbya]|uniref:hypothetical protein n=1 Tax=Leptolyngbya TaxID=47251 RepID=UPI0018EFD643|nr:hypothetical protein [Leptolyngbya sp. FACHB-1624]
MKSKVFKYITQTAKIALLPISIFFVLEQAVSAETLTTPNFTVTITRNCPEGYVTCNDVTYIGINRQTKQSIRLKGQTQHTLCADGVTPCAFLGYVFHNGNFHYFVSRSGDLQVYEDEKLIMEERGTWSEP